MQVWRVCWWFVECSPERRSRAGADEELGGADDNGSGRVGSWLVERISERILGGADDNGSGQAGNRLVERVSERETSEQRRRACGGGEQVWWFCVWFCWRFVERAPERRSRAGAGEAFGSVVDNGSGPIGM